MSMISQAGPFAPAKKKVFKWFEVNQKLILDVELYNKLDPMHFYCFKDYFNHPDTQFNLFWQKDVRTLHR